MISSSLGAVYRCSAGSLGQHLNGRKWIFGVRVCKSVLTAGSDIAGSGTKRGREGRRSGNRSHKRHRSTRADDSDDSLLVDEQDQGAAPWLRMGRGSGHPWLPPGLEAPGMSNLGMAASGWGQPGSHWGSSTPGIDVMRVLRSAW